MAGASFFPPAASGGGGGGTIATASPLSGDGSSGNPATLAQSALLLPLIDEDYNAWFAKQVKFAKSLSGALTGFRPIRPAGYGYNALGASAPATAEFGGDPKVEGGGFTTTAGTAQFWLESMSQFQLPKTGVYCFVGRVQFSAQSAGVEQNFGIGDGATGAVYVRSLSTTSTTHWFLSAGGSSTGTIALDTAWHDIAVFCNGTTVKSYIDQVQDASTPSAVASDQPYGLFIQSASTTLAKVKIAAALLAYVSVSGL
jgi:hypothetical protein